MSKNGQETQISPKSSKQKEKGVQKRKTKKEVEPNLHLCDIKTENEQSFEKEENCPESTEGESETDSESEDEESETHVSRRFKECSNSTDSDTDRDESKQNAKILERAKKINKQIKNLTPTQKGASKNNKRKMSAGGGGTELVKKPKKKFTNDGTEGEVIFCDLCGTQLLCPRYKCWIRIPKDKDGNYAPLQAPSSD